MLFSARELLLNHQSPSPNALPSRKPFPLPPSVRARTLWSWECVQLCLPPTLLVSSEGAHDTYPPLLMGPQPDYILICQGSAGP